MERKKMLITGFFFTFIIGTLMHFTYHWTGCSAITGLFVPVNESMWEHLKMLAMPMLLFGLFEKRGYAKELKNFWPARLLSIVSGMVILVLFYDLWLVVAGDGGSRSTSSTLSSAWPSRGSSTASCLPRDALRPKRRGPSPRSASPHCWRSSSSLPGSRRRSTSSATHPQGPSVLSNKRAGTAPAPGRRFGASRPEAAAF